MQKMQKRKPVIFNENKKGVSPLIATVLLIAFAVALGAVVMNWGRSFVQQQTGEAEETTKTKLGCSLKVNLEVQEIDGTPQICYGGAGSNGYMEIRLVNANEDAEGNIKGLSISVSGEQGVYNNETINKTIPAGLQEFVNLTYSYTSYGKVQNVRIVPKLSIGGKIIPCAGSPIVKGASEIRNCSA